MQILQGVPKLLHAIVLMETERKHAVLFKGGVLIYAEHCIYKMMKYI